MKNFILSLFFSFFPLTFADLGVDISIATSKESFACLLNQGYTFVIIRAYCSYGAVDPNLVTNIQNAQSAGFQSIQVYMFPCFPCGNPQNQVLELVEVITPYLEQVRDPIWIEATKYAWSTNQQQNQNFLFSMGSSIRSLAASTAGILTSQTDWTNIVGSNWVGSGGFTLWSIQHDDVPEINTDSYDFFIDYYLKQYEGPMTICNTTVNFDTDAGATLIE